MSQPSNSQANELRRRILEKVATDPQFRKSLLDSPEQTIADSEFKQEIEQLVSERSAIRPTDSPYPCTWTCSWTDWTF